MPSEIEIYGALSLFGIGITFQSDNQRLLGNALALYEHVRDEGENAQSSIYIVLRSYGVNRTAAARHHAEGPHLAIDRDGIAARADGVAGRGAIDFPEGAGQDQAGDMINTIVLFLVGHAGRVPLHASAIMMNGVAIACAGPSGAGKSTLALAASRAGLPVLSDDTIFVQTAPRLRLWSLGGPIHVFARDAEGDAGLGFRLRGGKWKKSLPIAMPARSADRAVLCVLSRGDKVALTPIAQTEAVAALVEAPEPGYEFYGEQSVVAARALAQRGAWRLTLSSDPADAIALVCQTFASGA